MAYICKELEQIVNDVKMQNKVLSINLIISEILKIYKEYFGIESKDIDNLCTSSELDVDIELYNERFLKELEDSFPDGIMTIFDVLEKYVTKDCDVKYDLISIGLSHRKIIDVKEQIEEELKFLENYTTNLSTSRTDEDIDIVGRDNELALLEIFLSMKTKNNVLITGKPGVGKTTLVEALARKINSGATRFELCGKQIISVDIARLLGNTKYRGEFEDRLTKLLDICAKNGYILFIDEAHIVIGAGASEGGISASNILKPYLLNNKLRFICATTEDEYKLVTKDKAFNRRFNFIYLEEFTECQMHSVAKKISEPYEHYHKIKFGKDDLEYIVSVLGNEKFSMKAFPDKYIEFVDFLGSYYSNLGIISRTQIEEGLAFYENSRILAV